jgi:SAM-dependent methyltransferase
LEHQLQTPSAWVCRWAHLIAPSGQVLDLACGYGRHTRYLAQRGLHLTALDRDAASLETLSDLPGVRVLYADVEAGPWPFPPDSFDAIVVTNYLHRPLYDSIRDSLRDGGVLIYETFMLGNERHGRPSNPEYLLRPGELLEAFGAACQVVAFEQGYTPTPKPAVIQRLCAVKAANQPFPLA